MTSSWDNFSIKIKKEFEQDKTSFLRKETISKTMHPRQEKLAKEYFSFLSKEHRSLLNITDSSTGNPWRVIQEHSLSNLQHLYYSTLIDPLKVDSITELGGGYGNLARIMRKRRYLGSYRIVDFEEIHNIQKYFLDRVYPNNNVEFIPIDKCSSDSENSLLFAAFSLNEFPLKDRNLIEEVIPGYKHILVIYNRKFDGIDNISYFKEFSQKFKETHNIVYNNQCKINKLSYIIRMMKK